MGDRANIVIDNNGSRVFLYTHWDGCELPEILQDALKLRLRWDDPQYLSRIIFQKMLGTHTGETGYGISARCHDNSYPLLVVDCGKQVVRLEAAGRYGVNVDAKEYTFQDYSDLEEVSWETLGAS